MPKVLIVGAGASRAEALFGGLPLEKLPPLDTDFFELASIHGDSTHLSTVKDYLKTNYSIDLDDSARIRMEEAFGLVYADTLTEPMPKGAKIAFSALCRIYNRVIALTTNDIKVNTSGPLATLIKNITKTDQLTIISFNQDLIIERTIDEIGKELGDNLWYPNSGYSINFSSLTYPSQSKSPDIFAVNNKVPSKIKILKPHGSLNWYIRTTDQKKVPSTLSNKKEIFCTRRRKLLVDMTYNSEHVRGRKKWYTWPLIVPPIFEKGGFLGHCLSEVWHTSFDAVAHANDIIVYGYSFPSADQQSQIFFRRATISNKIHRVLSVVNPDFTAVERAKTILDTTALMSASSVEDFFNSFRI